MHCVWSGVHLTGQTSRLTPGNQKANPDLDQRFVRSHQGGYLIFSLIFLLHVYASRPSNLDARVRLMFPAQISPIAVMYWFPRGVRIWRWSIMDVENLEKRGQEEERSKGGGWDVASLPLPRDLHVFQKRTEEMRKQGRRHMWDFVKRIAAEPYAKIQRRKKRRFTRWRSRGRHRRWL
ncbi:hypothetical protein LX36DRAFT_352958 [Colletotrichum falcatum]|nr:hypothetical protein LX36DRAFT_352958 [Colletotrichum falcatum]